MEKEELVLIVLAGLENDITHLNFSNYHYFLNLTLNQLNQLNYDQLNLLKDNFLEIMILANNLLGDFACRKPFIQKKTPINKTLLETWSLNLYHLNQQQINQLQNKQADFLQYLLSLQQQGKFNDKIYKSLANSTFLKQRFSDIQAIINQFLSA
jgi:hypothetical protein